MNKILLKKEISATNRYPLNTEKINNKKVISIITAICAFKDARSKNFKRGSIINASRKYSSFLDCSSSYISAHVSNIKCYHGLNKKSFKTNDLTISLILMTENFSLTELLMILKDCIKLNPKIDLYNYLRRKINKISDKVITNLLSISAAKNKNSSIISMSEAYSKKMGKDALIFEIKANYVNGVLYGQHMKRNTPKHYEFNRIIKLVRDFDFDTIIKLINFIRIRNIKIETARELRNLLVGTN